jgi:glutamate-1-semialdehyde 2,1-aminomutase
MAAGIASLRMLATDEPYQRLERLGGQMRQAVLDAARAKGLAVQFPQRGSMFSLFFNPEPVRDYDSALRSDGKLFARLFHSCLERGVYLAPSAYEAGFLSTAHEGRDIDQACAVLSDAIAGL